MAIDTTASSRVRRQLLPGLAPYAGANAGPEQWLSALWRDALGMDEVGIDDDFFALGGTSMQAARLFDAIEQRCGQRLPLALLYEASTIRSLARCIGVRQPGGSPARCLVAIANGPATTPPLFVIPGMGGNVVGLVHLARALASAGPVFGLQSPGLDGNEEPLQDIGDIARRFLAEIRPIAPDRRPLRLLGVCWGALVALEIARQVVADAGPPPALILLDPPPPGSDAVMPTGRWRQSAMLPRFLASRLHLYWRSLRALPAGERGRYVGERLRTAREILRQRDLFRGDRSELRRREVTDANASAARRYVPPAYAGPVHLLFTAGRPDGRSRQARGFWQAHLRGCADPRYVPGRDTGDAITAEHAGGLATVVRNCLAGRV
jgi:thioesterase domain-containing protein/acyl carrier protein